MTNICIVSGFLGAGKTTFIKKLLKVFNPSYRVVVLENEFGEEGIDGEVIKEEGYDVIELEQGCICCSLKINFLKAVQDIILKFNPSYIIIEPTGLGVLSEIIKVIECKELKEMCKITSLITIIDGLNYEDELEAFGDFFQDQIKSANTLVVSKTLEISSETKKRIVNSLENINKDAGIIVKSWDEIENKQLFDLLNGKIKYKNIQLNKNIGDTIKNIRTVSIKCDKEISIKNLQEILEKLKIGYAGEIIRAKGFIRSYNCILHFNYVKGHYDIGKRKEDFLNNDLFKVCFIGKSLSIHKINILFNGAGKIKIKKILKLNRS
ncbi:CobW family GTP-binding protein [Haloimpatiens sp. FM7315]|uniref:CobW family GTP-binding protein n=1 Tax=Haloimpatiens sp. FM7315 TaxID=3298609 RepID=UPI0035A3827F